MNAFTFLRYTDEPSLAVYAYVTDAMLPNGGGLVRVSAYRRATSVSLAVTAAPLYSAMSFTVEQARAIAAELLAAAGTIDGEPNGHMEGALPCEEP